jgi:hypothetical protein
MFNIVFPKVRGRPYRGPDQASPRPLLPYFLGSILILFFPLHAGFTSGLFPAGFLTTTAYALCTSHHMPNIRKQFNIEDHLSGNS